MESVWVYVCVPVEEHRDPLHGNNDRLAVWGLRVRVGGATGRAGFLLAWGETNMTRRDAHRLCYSRARVNLTSNPCHVWPWRKHRWEDDRGGGWHQLSQWGRGYSVSRDAVSQDSDQNFKLKMGQFLRSTFAQFTFLSQFSLCDWCLMY